MGWRFKFGAPLAGWLVESLTKSTITQMDSLEDLAKPQAGAALDKLPVHPAIKQELEQFLQSQGAVQLPAWLLLVGGVVIGSLMGALMGWAQPVGRWTSYQGDKLLQTFRFDPGAVTRLWLRGFPSETGKEAWWDDLKDQGWSEERIAAAKELSQLLPTPQDLVTWTAREVFEPEAIERYGLDEEFDKLDLSLFGKVGMSEDMARNYWRAHWQHTSFSQMVELRRRDLVSDDELFDWFRLVEIPPHWRPLLMQLVWEIPTRVDVRRWWDMRTIEEGELSSLYQKMGYHGRDNDNYVLWTKVYTAFPDLIARYRNAWITEEQVRAELIELGMPEARAQELLETKIKKPAQQERVETTRQLTRSLIIKGAKQDNLNKKQSIQRLMDLNYAQDEAELIWEIEIEGAESPETPLEFERATQIYRRAVGLPAKEIPQELIDAEKALIMTERELKAAREKEEPEARINELQALRAEQATRYRELLVLYQADSESTEAT